MMKTRQKIPDIIVMVVLRIQKMMRFFGTPTDNDDDRNAYVTE